MHEHNLARLPEQWRYKELQKSVIASILAHEQKENVQQLGFPRGHPP